MVIESTTRNRSANWHIYASTCTSHMAMALLSLLAFGLMACNRVPDSFAGRWRLKDPYSFTRIFWELSGNSAKWSSSMMVKREIAATFSVRDTKSNTCVLELKGGEEVIIEPQTGTAILRAVEPGGTWTLRLENGELVAERQFKFENDKTAGRVRIEMDQAIVESYPGGVYRLRFAPDR